MFICLTKHSKLPHDGGSRKQIDNTNSQKEASPKTKVSANTPFPMILVQYLIILDINGLFCFAIHVLNDNKMVAPHPNYYQFLQLCSTWFDIGIRSLIIMPNFIPILKLLLGEEGCDIKHVFIWGAKKCEQIEVPHPLNPKQPLVLKKYEHGV